MWIRYRASQSYNDLVEYKIAQNKAVKEYRKAKKQFERKLAKDIKSNPKSFYAYVRSKTKVKEVVGPLRDTSNQLVSDNEVMCEILNEYFGSVFTSEDDTPDAQRRSLGEFGDLTRQSFMEVWNGESYRDLVATYRNRALCLSCNMRKPAGGGP